MYIRKYYMLLCLLMPFMAWAKNDTLPVGKVSVSDTVPVSVRTLPNAFRAIAQPEIRQGDLFRGGENDGFGVSCLPPTIIDYGQAEFNCVEDSIVMWIKAVGTDITYRWQKFDATGFRDLTDQKDYLKGTHTDRLIFSKPDKKRDDGVYRCLVSNGCGDTPSESFDIVINSAPRLISSLSQSMTWECVGAAGRNLAVVVEALDSKSLKYMWWRQDTVTRERVVYDIEKYNSSTLTVRPTSRADEGIYGVTASNECGVVSDSAFMPVYMPVTVEELNIEDGKILACEGESVDFRVKLAGGGVYHYALKKVNVISRNPLRYEVIQTVGQEKSQITVPNVTMSMEGDYVWEVANDCGRDTSMVFKLVVHQVPDYFMGYEFPDTLACEGSELIMKCEAEGIGIEYEWYLNGEKTGVTGNIYAIDSVREEHAGIYTCVARNVCIRQSQSRAIHVTLDPLPQILRQPLLLDPFCVGSDSVEMSVRLGSARVDSMRWRFNSEYLYDIPGKVDGSTETKLTLNDLGYEGIGMYYIELFNHCGRVHSEIVQLSMDQPARLLKGMEGDEMILCAGDDQQLIVKAEGSLPIRYRWLCNEQVIAESDSNVVSLQSGKVDETAQYTVQVENICGGEVQKVNLKVARIEHFKLEGGGDYCDGHDAMGVLNMIGSDTNIVYSLYREPDLKVDETQGTGDTLKFENLAAGVYYMVATDTNGCAQTLKDRPEVFLKETPSLGRLVLLNQSCQNNPGANVLMTQWEDGVQYKLYRKYGTDDFEWYKYMMFLGGNEQMGSPAEGEKKIWEGLGEGRYKVVAVNLLTGCTRDMLLEDSIILRPVPRRYSLISPHDNYVNCSHANELSQLEADGYEKGTTYRLLKNGEQYGQSLRYSPIRWSQIDEGEYVLEAENEWGCKSESRPVTITNIKSPSEVKLGGNGAICGDDTDPYKELIITKSEDGVIYRIYQDFPERFIEEVRGTGDDVTVILPKKNGVYVIDAYDATGQCKVRMESTYTVGVSNFQTVAEPAEIYVDRGEATYLHIAVDGLYAQPMTVNWQPTSLLFPWWVNTGDDHPFKDPYTEPIYNDQTFVVTATDALGCSVTDSVEVKVTGKKLDVEILFSKEHRHYYGVDYGRYHSHAGCTFIRTEKSFWDNSWHNSYDLYYCCTEQEATDTIVYRNDEVYFCSECSGGDYNFKYNWSFVTADGNRILFPKANAGLLLKARESGYLFLDVTSMGQHRRDSIWIEVLRRPLSAEICDSDCNIRLDSVAMCKGERIEFCGHAVGGDEPHIYRWFDDVGDLSSANRVIYKPLKSGYVWFLTTSDGIEVLDSVYIKLLATPKKVEVEDPGVRCVQLNKEEIIRVPSPQKGMNYVLEYRAPGEKNREYGQHFDKTQGTPLGFLIQNPMTEPGIYKVRVDTVVGDKVCSTYLDSIEFITPPPAAQFVDTTYCFGDFGVRLEMRSVEDDIRYSILSEQGTNLETIEKPTAQFKKAFTEAPYFLRTERVGEMGSCAVDLPFRVTRSPQPDVSLEVVTEAHGPVCEGSEITITVKATEKDVKYELLSPSNRVEDTFIGDGNDQAFSAFPRPAGVYLIRATRGNCSAYLDQSVRVHALPRNINTPPVHYCYTPPLSPTSQTAPIEVHGMQSNTRYYLQYKGTILDSLDGSGTKVFDKELSEGQYEILAKDLSTQCISPINLLQVVADQAPEPFKLQGGCGARQEVSLKSSQLRVTYELRRDNVIQKTLRGTGAALSFGEQTVSGIYTVWGINDTTQCRTKMDGVVAVYQLDTCALEVVGSICKVGGDGRVELHYPCSRPGWCYFVTKLDKDKRTRGVIYEGTGGELWWDRIGGKILKEGTYELWAGNECDTIKVTSVEVIKRNGPKGKLVKPEVACRGEKVEIKVTAGGEDLKYTLLGDVDSYQKVLHECMGQKEEFSMGSYAGYTTYRLKASYPDGSCSKVISIQSATLLDTPNPLDIRGKDVCMVFNEETGDIEGEIEIGLPLEKEEEVNYFLCAEDINHRVDQILVGDNRFFFQNQNTPGCYFVYAEHNRTNCTDTMNGVFCLGAVPDTLTYLYVDDLNGNSTEAILCIGDTCTLRLVPSQKGVHYQLYRDEVIPVGKSLNGTGGAIRFPNITEPGEYRVLASNDCAEHWMQNVVTVRFTDYPDVGIEDYYYYCPDKTGATIIISDSESGSVYKLYEHTDWDNLLETKTSTQTGDDVVFDQLLLENKRYVIEATTRYGCSNKTEFEVKRDTLPKVDFTLRSTTDSVICQEACTELFLTGSEPNVNYTLYNEQDVEYGFMIGSGDSLNFGKVCDGGIYHVVASRHYRPYCSAPIPGELPLRLVDTIRELIVTTNRTHYCYGDALKADVMVEKAQRGVTYQLYRNGQPTELKIRPNADGSLIRFKSVEGGTCEEPNIYTVLASREKCSRFMFNSVQVYADSPIDESTLRFTPERNMVCCEGDTIAFKAVAAGCDLTYRWLQDDKELPNEETYLQLQGVKADQTGLYTCHVENTCGSVVVGRAHLDIIPKPVILEHIGSIHFCEGQSVYVGSMMDYVHTGNYRWYRTINGKDSVYSTVNFMEFTKITSSDAGEYICEGSSTCETVRDTFYIYVDANAASLKMEKLTDTLCVGSHFRAEIPNIVPFENVLWKFNGRETAMQGYTYIIDTIAMEDDGIYSVAINNACGEKDIVVKQLIVDDSIKIFDMTPSRDACGNAPLELYIKTQPTARVDYTWYEGEDVLGKGEKLNTIVKPGEMKRTYRVFYGNACGHQWADVHIRTNSTIDLIHPEKELKICAGEPDSELKVEVKNVDVYSYQWLYQSKNSQKIDSLGTDSKQVIEANVNRTGFYWCKMQTACGDITSTSSWVKVDNVPVLTGLPARDTLCLKGSLEYEVQGSGGGGLLYEWFVTFKDGKRELKLKQEGLEFESNSVLITGPIDETWDSAYIVCRASNDCGIDSMKMLLLVEKSRELIVHPSPDTTVCAGGYAHIRVELKNGFAPWSYIYQDTLGREETRIVRNSSIDEWDLDRPGKYTVRFVRDGHSCNYADGNLEFEVKSRPAPVARIEVVGKDTLCPGEKGQLRVVITYPGLKGGLPGGPWEVNFVKQDGTPADELNVTTPYYIYGGSVSDTAIIDTLRPFALAKATTIYIGSIRDVGSSSSDQCGGQPVDSAAFHLLERDNLRFDFRSEKDTLGYCETVLLDTLLNPNMDGEFYIDGIRSQLGIFNSPPLAPGRHIIKYKTHGACPMSNDSVRLVIMPKPQLIVTPRDTAVCPGQTIEVKLDGKGAEPFQVKYELRSVKRNGDLLPAPSNFEVTTPKITKISNSFADDSLRIITPMYMIDRFGCWADRTDSLQAIVRFAKNPDFEFYGRHRNYDNGDWADWRHAYMVTKGDSVDFKVELKSGATPWSYTLIQTGKPVAYVGPVFAQDTVFKAGDEGQYQVTVTDGNSCFPPGRQEVKQIYFREPGYLRLRVLLEGPFLTNQGIAMRDSLHKRQVLPMHQLTSWPDAKGKGIVDWIMVETRERPDGEPIACDTFLLRTDGVIITSEGSDILPLQNATKLNGPELLYIIVRHRNHISIMSKQAVTVVDEAQKNNAQLFDFTQESNLYVPTGSRLDLHAEKLGNGLWGMAAGYDFMDADDKTVPHNHLVSISHPNTAKYAESKEMQGNYSGYYWRDVDMNGIVEWPDDIQPGENIFSDKNKNLYKNRDAWILHKNRNKYSAVPVVLP